MAKYITKENLPVFKYVNPVSMDFYEEAQNDLNTMLVYYKNIQDSLRQDKPEIFSEEEKVHMINLILKCRKYYPQSFFADGPGQQGILSKIKERVDAIDLANTQFIGENIRIILGLCIRMLNIMTFTPILQGKVFDQSENHIYYPKLFLITDAFFIKRLSFRSMDFDDLFRLFPLENSFETYIQGKIRESKQGFHIRKIKQDEIAVSIWDRTCGCYAFSLIREGESSYLLVPMVSCGKKRDLKRCEHWKGNRKSCVEKYEDCPERRIQTAHAVLLCLQEYLVRKKKQQVTESKKRKKTPEKERTKDFQPEDMINIHTANLRPTKSLGVRKIESMAVGD